MNENNPTTCEECLGLLTGIQIPRPRLPKLLDNGFIVQKNDATILFSIAKQLSRGIAMTDRQYALVRKKLLEYEDQFDDKGINVEEVSKNLLYDLRDIDRSHWLKILRWNDEDVLGIRFPFNKKIISRIEELRKLSKVKDLAFKDNTHYFPYTATNLFTLVEIANRFDKKFDIQKPILETYEQLKEYNDNKEKYLPGIFNNTLKNIPQSAIDNLTDELGEVTDDNYLQYYDRRKLYGLHYFDQHKVDYAKSNASQIANDIVERSGSAIIFKKDSCSFNNILEALFELKRLPVLILIDEKTAYDDIVETYNTFRHSINNKDISVYFRLDNTDDSHPFNDYVKNNNLNNPVANETKIVYINTTKLPKTLLKADWQPRSVINYGSKGLGFNKVTQYAQQFDLQIIYEDSSSIGYWNRAERRYTSGNM